MQTLTCYCNILTYQILCGTIRQEITLNGRDPEVCSCCFCFTVFACYLENYFSFSELLLLLLTLASNLLITFSWRLCIFRFLTEHPEYTRDGVKLSQFSFQIPRPLQENYVRKRSARLPSSYEAGGPVEHEQGTYNL